MKLEIGQTVVVNLPPETEPEVTSAYWGTNGKFGEVIRFLGPNETAVWVKIFSDNKARGYDIKDVIPVSFDDNGTVISDSYSDAVIRWLS